MSDGDDTVDDIAMNSAVAAEATTSLKSILEYGDTANDTNKQSSSTSPRKPKFGVHDDSPLKIAMDQFPGSSNNIEEGLVQQPSPPPQSSKRASFDDAVGLGSPIPKRLSSRASFDDNAPSVKETLCLNVIVLIIIG